MLIASEPPTTKARLGPENRLRSANAFAAFVSWTFARQRLLVPVLTAIFQCQQQSSAQNREQTRAGFWHIAEELVARAHTVITRQATAGVVEGAVVAFRTGFHQGNHLKSRNRLRELSDIRRIKRRNISRL